MVDVPGTGPQLLGNLRQVDALLLVVRDPGEVEELRLELLVADRDHVERRLERVRQQAKSGDPKLRKEVEDLERLLAHVEAGGTLADYAEELPPELDPLTTKPVVVVENGAERHRPRARGGARRARRGRRRRRSGTAADRRSTRSPGG